MRKSAILADKQTHNSLKINALTNHYPLATNHYSKMVLSEINIYPVKSLGGISLGESKIEQRGLEFDRRWMLVDAENRFVTQRELPKMALFRLEIREPFLEIFHTNRPAERLQIPLRPDWKSLPAAAVQTWSWRGQARIHGREAADFFSENLETDLRLAFMPDSTRRQVDLNFAEKGQFTSFADAYSFLLIGEASLDFLNEKLVEKGAAPVPMNRFRPNLVVRGSAPFEEDDLRSFSIDNQRFKCAKPCARCVMTTINQETADRSAEPLKTLSTFRFLNNKVLFGQNLVWLGDPKKGSAVLKIGQSILADGG